MLEPDKVLHEMKALQTHFQQKRDYVMDRLKKLGFKFKHVPDSTFYIWLDLSGLPDEICDGLGFFEACLKERVIVGRFRPLNPSPRYSVVGLMDLQCQEYSSI